MPLNAIKNYVKEELPGIYEAGKFIRDRAEDFNENREQVFEGVQQQQDGKDSTQINEEVRPIGSEAVLNGQPVFWSGQNYGWQSKGSFDKLMDEGQFRMGGIAAQRFGNSITESIPQEVKDFATEKITDATTAAVDWYDSQSYENKRRYINPTLNIANGVVTLADQGLEFISEKTNTSRFITDELVMAALTAGGSAAIRRATPAIKQGAKTAIKAIDKYGPTIDDIFPPTPPVALATAGAAPSVQLNVEKGGAVMKAVTARDREILLLGGVSTGDKIISYKQAEHLTRRAGEVQERVDKLPLMRDKLNEMIENGADLQEIKNFRDTIENTKAMLHRKRSNVSVPTPEDPLWYQTTAGKAAKRQEELARGLKTGEYLEAHHLFPKVLSSAFFDRMDWMINKGIAEADDLVLMNNIAIKLGAKPGDYKSGMLNMRTKPHNELHTAMDYAKDEFNELEWAEKVNKAKNVDELLVLWRDTIQDVVLPTAQDAVSINKLDDTLQSVSTSYSGTGPIKYWKNKKKAESKEIKRRQRQKKTNK